MMIFKSTMNLRIIIFLKVFPLLLCHGQESMHNLCKLYDDTYGKWILNPTKEPNPDESINQTKALRHYVGGDPGEALWFDKVIKH